MEYNLILKTPPIVEPFTISEIKDYLKLSDFGDSCNGFSSNESILQESRNVGIVNGLPIDVLGFKSTVQLVCGTLSTGGKLDCKVQESSDNILWVDIYNFTQITTSNDNETYLYSYVGDKRYIRVIGELTINGGLYSANIILSQGYTDEDIYIQSLITSAREWCENYQSRAYITQTWEMSFESFCNNIIEIPKGNLQKIDSITYKNSSNVTNSLIENTDFIVSKRGQLGKICPAFNKEFPQFEPYPLDPIIITFTAGYGDNSSFLPLKIKLAMKLLISHWFNNRIPIDSALNNIKEVEFTLTSLLWQDRLVMI